MAGERLVCLKFVTREMRKRKERKRKKKNKKKHQNEGRRGKKEREGKERKIDREAKRGNGGEWGEVDRSLSTRATRPAFELDSNSNWWRDEQLATVDRDTSVADGKWLGSSAANGD